MDKFGSDLVNLHHSQADHPDVTSVHLRSTQEDTRMVKPELVDRIRELSGQGLGSKRIAQQLGISRNSVRRYLAGATVGFQERPAARRLNAVALREVQDLFGTVAEGNTVVVQQELARQGMHVELRTLQRAVGPLRHAQRAEALATVQFETPPGQQIQIDFGEKVGAPGVKRVFWFLADRQEPKNTRDPSSRAPSKPMPLHGVRSKALGVKRGFSRRWGSSVVFGF